MTVPIKQSEATDEILPILFQMEIMEEFDLTESQFQIWFECVYEDAEWPEALYKHLADLIELGPLDDDMFAQAVADWVRAEEL